MVYSYLKILRELSPTLGHLESLGTRLTDNSIISKLKESLLGIGYLVLGVNILGYKTTIL